MPPNDERALIQQLKQLEASHTAAAMTAARVAARPPPIQYKFSLPDAVGRRVFLALLRRHGLKPFRLPRQRHTTVMVMAPPGLVEETLWPAYLALGDALHAYLGQVAFRVIGEALHGDMSDAAEALEHTCT
jgi:hypothetical protein